MRPKITAVWRIWPPVELYADAGQGFHSNDIRGATITVTPGANDPADKVNLILAPQCGEIGAGYSKGGLSTTLSLLALHANSELVYNGDGGDTSTTNAPHWVGIEVLVASRLQLQRRGFARPRYRPSRHR